MNSDNKVVLLPNQESVASFVSKLYFCWLVPLFRKGSKKTLEVEDLCEVESSEKSDRLCELLENAWSTVQTEAKLSTGDKIKSKPQFKMAVWRVFGRHFMLLGLLALFFETIKTVQPVLMGYLIRYFRPGTEMSLFDASLFAASLIVCSLLLSTMHWYYYSVQRVGMQIRAACSALIFKKALRLSSSSLRETSVGQIINLLSTDVAKFDAVVAFFHHIWIAPLNFFIIMGLLWYELGVSCLAGFGAMLIIMPLQGYIGRQTGKFRREYAFCTDKRVSLMSEVLNGIRVIKMYAWEEPFSKLVDKFRLNEIRKLRAMAALQGVLFGLYYSTGKLAIFSCVIMYFLLHGTITAEQIFVSSALFNVLRLSFGLFLPLAMQFTVETFVSLRRIEEFLLLDEKGDQPTMIELSTKATNNLMLDIRKQSSDAPEGEKSLSFIEFSDLSATWDEARGMVLSNISLRVDSGELLMVIGPVGAGKSSLLLSILGELRACRGSVKVSGSIVYSSQQAWIFPATLRQNVVFGRPFNAEKYKKALQASAMEKDIAGFADGDLTLVGDRGVQLSGGQKARLTLARVFYEDADVYLLDDPLSAVDSAVGRFLFQSIRKELSSKVCVLVTHQLHYVQQATKVVLLQHGKIVASGCPNELRAKCPDVMDKFLQETQDSYEREKSLTTTSKNDSLAFLSYLNDENYAAPKRRSDSLNSDNAEAASLIEKSGDKKRAVAVKNGSLRKGSSEMSVTAIGITPPGTMPEEEKTIGAVKWQTYFEYLRSMGNCCLLFVVVLFFVAVQALFNFSDFWLNLWYVRTLINDELMLRGTIFKIVVVSITDQAHERATDFEVRVEVTSLLNISNEELPELTTSSQKLSGNRWDISPDQYLHVYIWLTVCLFVGGVIRAVVFRCMQTSAAYHLHSRMFKAVIRTSLSFFDNNPTGRILNRFSKDVGAMDDQLAFTLFDFFQGILVYVGVAVVVSFINPWIVPGLIPIMLVFVCIRNYFLRTSRDIRRLEAVTKSPVLSHVSSSINGLTTIRAFSAENSVTSDFHYLQDLNSAAFSLTLSTSRCFAVVIEWLSILFIIMVITTCFVLASHFSSGEVALCLFYATYLTLHFSYLAQQSAIMETAMVSVERLLEYTNLKPEGYLSTEGTTPSSWPDKGKIVFENVCMKYSADAPYVLKNINCVIKSREKIGIVGRTGAGKSSLLSALFRLRELAEGKIIIDGIDCSKIGLSVLRQRISIIPQDPVLFIGTLQSNLDPFEEFSDVELWDALDKVDLKGFVEALPQQLETLMDEGGANLSVGQKQLICLARALLRKSRILVIDEATSNVDPETDALIQRVLASITKSFTVLTIAHRLNTVIGYDRVMVLKDGEIVEFDTPHSLLENQDSVFSGLVTETGDQNAKMLKEAAERTFASRLLEQ